MNPHEKAIRAILTLLHEALEMDILSLRTAYGTEGLGLLAEALTYHVKALSEGGL